MNSLGAVVAIGLSCRCVRKAPELFAQDGRDKITFAVVLWCVGQCRGSIQRRQNFIGAEDVGHLDSMRHRFDLLFGDLAVQFSKLLDIRYNIAELQCHPVDFGGTEQQPAQERDLFDFLAGEGHIENRLN